MTTAGHKYFRTVENWTTHDDVSLASLVARATVDVEPGAHRLRSGVLMLGASMLLGAGIAGYLVAILNLNH